MGHFRLQIDLLQRRFFETKYTIKEMNLDASRNSRFGPTTVIKDKRPKHPQRFISPRKQPRPLHPTCRPSTRSTCALRDNESICESVDTWSSTTFLFSEKAERQKMWQQLLCENNCNMPVSLFVVDLESFPMARSGSSHHSRRLLRRSCSPIR